MKLWVIKFCIFSWLLLLGSLRAGQDHETSENFISKEVVIDPQLAKVAYKIALKSFGHLKCEGHLYHETAIKVDALHKALTRFSVSISDPEKVQIIKTEEKTYEYLDPCLRKGNLQSKVVKIDTIENEIIEIIREETKSLFNEHKEELIFYMHENIKKISSNFVPSLTGKQLKEQFRSDADLPEAKECCAIL